MSDRFVILITDERAYLARFVWSQRQWTRVELRDWAVEARVLPSEASDLYDLARTLGRSMREAHPRGFAAGLIVPSTWCFLRELQLDEAAWTTRGAAFAAEEYFPVELEGLTCGCQCYGGRRGLVAAAFTDGLRGLIEGFERCDIAIERITPNAALLAGGPSTTESANVILRDRGHIVAHVAAEVTQIRVMQTLPPSATGTGLLDHHVAAAVCAADTGTWRLFDLSDDPPAGRLALPGTAHCVGRAESVGTLLGRAAASPDLLDLRTAELAYRGRFAALERRGRSVLVAFLVFLAILGLHHRVENVRYAAAVDELRPAVLESYQAVFPGAAVPPGAALRLRSERMKLEGLTQAAPGVREWQANSLRSLETLHLFASNLPPAIKLDVSEVVLETESIRVAGRTRSHEAAGEIVRVLNRTPGLDVDPPRTKLRNDGTVELRLTARRGGHADES